MSRSIRETEAKNKCPDLQIAYVPVRRGKADLTCYRQASAEVIRVLSEFTDIIERASIDEAFLDVTELVHKRIRTCDLENLLTVESIPNTYIPELKGESSEGGGFVGWVRDNGRSSDLLLATGAMVANDIRKEVFERTGFTCSAGVGYNKVQLQCADQNADLAFWLTSWVSKCLLSSINHVFRSYNSVDHDQNQFDYYSIPSDGSKALCWYEQAQWSNYPTPLCTAGSIPDHTHWQNVSTRLVFRGRFPTSYCNI